MGVIAVTVMAFVMPKMLAGLPANAAPGQPAMPPEAMAAVLVGTFVIYGVLFVVMPAIWTIVGNVPTDELSEGADGSDPTVRPVGGKPHDLANVVVGAAVSGLSLVHQEIPPKFLQPKTWPEHLNSGII